MYYFMIPDLLLYGLLNIHSLRQTKYFLFHKLKIEKVHLDDLDLYVVTSAVVATSVFLWSSELKLTKKLTRLVSTSNKRSSSGEMKKRPEEGDIYREIWILTPMDQGTELW